MRKYLLVCLLLFVISGIYAQQSTLIHKDLSSCEFRTNDGRKLKISDLQGKFVLLDVWAVGCGECLMQFPALGKLEKEYKDAPVAFVALCIENNEKAWVEFVKKRGFAGRHIITSINSPFLSENGIRGIPRMIILDKNGKVLVPNAEKPTDPLLKKRLDELLKAN